MNASGFSLGHPGYVFRGRTYKSLSGLMTALAKDAGAVSVCFPSPNVARADSRGADGKFSPVGFYDLTPPKFGEVQHVTKREGK